MKKAASMSVLLAVSAAVLLLASCATGNFGMIKNDAEKNYLLGLYGESTKTRIDFYDQGSFTKYGEELRAFIQQTKSMDDAAKASQLQILDGETWVSDQWLYYCLYTNGVSVLWKVKDIQVSLEDAQGKPLAENVYFHDSRAEVRTQLGRDYVYYYTWRIKTTEPFTKAIAKERLPAHLIVKYPNGTQTIYQVAPAK